MKSLGGPTAVLHGISDTVTGPYDWNKLPSFQTGGENPAFVRCFVLCCCCCYTALRCTTLQENPSTRFVHLLSGGTQRPIALLESPASVTLILIQPFVSITFLFAIIFCGTWLPCGCAVARAIAFVRGPKGYVHRSRYAEGCLLAVDWVRATVLYSVAVECE